VLGGREGGRRTLSRRCGVGCWRLSRRRRARPTFEEGDAVVGLQCAARVRFQLVMMASTQARPRGVAVTSGCRCLATAYADAVHDQLCSRPRGTTCKFCFSFVFAIIHMKISTLVYNSSNTIATRVYFFLFFFYLSCHTTLTPQSARAQSEKYCRRRSASSGQKTRGCIKGEKPGRRRYQEVLPRLEQRVEKKDIEHAPAPRGASAWPEDHHQNVKNVHHSSSPSETKTPWEKK